jgi:hypothetical protein
MCENASDLDALRFEVYQSREAILIPADVKNDQPASLSQIGGRKGSLERFGMGPYGIFREDQKAASGFLESSSRPVRALKRSDSLVNKLPRGHYRYLSQSRQAAKRDRSGPAPSRGRPEAIRETLRARIWPGVIQLRKIDGPLAL